MGAAATIYGTCSIAPQANIKPAHPDADPDRPAAIDSVAGTPMDFTRKRRSARRIRQGFPAVIGRGEAHDNKRVLNRPQTHQQVADPGGTRGRDDR